MEALKKLKSVCQKVNFQSFDKLEPGEYIVHSFTLVDTKLGQRIKVDLDNMFVLLPERFALGLSQDTILTLNETPKIMIFKGKDATKQNRYVSQFVCEQRKNYSHIVAFIN